MRVGKIGAALHGELFHGTAGPWNVECFADPSELGVGVLEIGGPHRIKSDSMAALLSLKLRAPIASTGFCSLATSFASRAPLEGARMPPPVTPG